MKKKILVGIIALNIGIIAYCNGDDEKQLQVKVSDQQVSSSSVMKLPQVVQNHLIMTATGFALISAGFLSLSRYNLENIYSDSYANPIMPACMLILEGIGLLTLLFNAPETKKTDEFIEATN